LNSGGDMIQATVGFETSGMIRSALAALEARHD